jgi:hypothetical protein
VNLEWEGEAEDRAAAHLAAEKLAEFHGNVAGEAIEIANEFAEIRVQKVVTRNGLRLLIEASKSGQWVTLDPLELEALTWQNKATFSAMVGHPFGPLIEDD